jgi:hypothetical protein
MASGLTDRLREIADPGAMIDANAKAPKKRGPCKPRKRNNST